jgi:hypothetical protein
LSEYLKPIISLPENQRKPTEIPMEIFHQEFLESCSGVMTWIFSDDFTNGIAEGFKPG